MYTYSDSAMPHVLAITAYGVCHHLLVPPLAAASVFLALMQQHTLRHTQVGILLRGKHPLQQLSKRGGGLFSKGGPILGDYGNDVSTHKPFLREIWYCEHRDQQ